MIRGQRSKKEIEEELKNAEMRLFYIMMICLMESSDKYDIKSTLYPEININMLMY